MYAIIYWENDDTVKPMLNPDGTLFLNSGLDGADVDAWALEKKNPGFYARVISIEGVKE